MGEGSVGGGGGGNGWYSLLLVASVNDVFFPFQPLLPSIWGERERE